LRGGGVFPGCFKTWEVLVPQKWFGTPLILKVVEKILPRKKILYE